MGGGIKHALAEMYAHLEVKETLFSLSQCSYGTGSIPLQEGGRAMHDSAPVTKRSSVLWGSWKVLRNR